MCCNYLRRCISRKKRDVSRATRGCCSLYGTRDFPFLPDACPKKFAIPIALLQLSLCGTGPSTNKMCPHLLQPTHMHCLLLQHGGLYIVCGANQNISSPAQYGDRPICMVHVLLCQGSSQGCLQTWSTGHGPGGYSVRAQVAECPHCNLGCEIAMEIMLDVAWPHNI